LGSFEICLVGVSPPKLPVATELVTKSSGESRVWQAWHVLWASLWRREQKSFVESKICSYSFLNLYF